jgi:serine/threonine-protein kinase
MAPEAIRMEPLSTSFDLWSACVVLFEALTGACPFRGATLPDIHARIALGAMPDLMTLRPDCPPRLAAFFAEALAYDRGRRPHSAQALRKALSSLQRDLQPV